MNPSAPPRKWRNKAGKANWVGPESASSPFMWRSTRITTT